MKKFYIFLLLFSCIFSFSQTVKQKDSLLSIAVKNPNDSLRIVAYNKLFFIEVYTNINQSKKYYNAIFAIAKAKKSNFAYAKAYNLKGVAYDVSGKMDSALYCYKKSLTYSKLSKAVATEGSALNNIGLLEWNEGNYYDALLYFNQALSIFEKIGNKELQANALSNIGLIYDEISDLKKAEIYLKKALKIRQEIDDKYGLSVSYVNLGKLFERQKRFTTAIDYYKKGISIKRKNDDFLGIAIANYNLASSLMHLKNLDEAFKTLKEAEKICQENEAESNIVENVYSGLIEIYIRRKDFSTAKIYNEKMLEIAQKNEDVERLGLYYHFDSEISFATNNFEKAYLSLQKKDSIKAITEGIELKKAINLFETKYQSEKKEKQILQIRNELIQKELETKRKNTWLIIITVVAFFILVLGYLIYRQQKLKNSQQEQEFKLKTAIKEIESQNELQQQRLNISRDLHDNIGAQLTFIISSVDTIKYAFDIKNSKLSEKLESINQFTKDTIIELRDTIWAMNNSEITFEELRSRILNFIDKAKESKDDIYFKFTIDDSLNNHILTSVVAMNIYRTIQEAINNAMKYANPKEILVAVNSLESFIEITIRDDGKGFDTENAAFGNGLNNMKKRALEINSSLNIESIIEKGTQITLKIPMKNT